MKCKWIGITVLVAYFCTLIEGNDFDLTVMTESLPGYAVTHAIDQLNASRCRTEMEEFRDGVNHRVLWALKMLDTSGRPESGYVKGNFLWLGERHQCESLSEHVQLVYMPAFIKKYSHYRNAAEEFPPYELNFFAAYILQNSTIHYRTLVHREDTITLGLCLPASCTEQEVATMVTKVLDERLLLIDRLYSLDLKLIRVSDLKLDSSFFDVKIILIIIVLLALLGVVIVGTLYDILVIQKQLKKRKEYSNDHNKVNDSEKIEMDTDVEKKISHNQENSIVREVTTFNRTGEILACFSFYSNIQEIFDLSNTSRDIKIIHGIRFFGTLWVVLAHIGVYKSNIANMGEAYLTFSSLPVQVITNATLSVESFFFLGGFVLTIGHLRGRKGGPMRGHLTDLFNALVKRYIRLTPTHIVIMLIVILTFTYASHTSLLLMDEAAHELCPKYWWTNLLYINNFYNWEELCMTWTWYLSNDMQFFVLGTLLLLISINHFYTSLSIGTAIIIATSSFRAYLTYVIGYTPSVDATFWSLRWFYLRPWMRIQPYLVGMATALLLDKLNYKLHLSKKILAICWTLSILCNCTIIFGVPTVARSVNLSIVYQIFFKFGWSLGIGWLFVACLTNNGGIINQILSLSWWIPFSRVSLSAYLINPVVVFALDMITDYPMKFEIVNGACVALGQCVLTYLSAFIISAVCEVPMGTLLQRNAPSKSKR